ncbi:MAG: DUF1440 domain-containing protein [Acidobacteria bacterium]|nr:DUF1440 domain-containing protein [Acidobacteriota bacterium]
MKKIIAKGVIAGLVAGIIATGIKTVWEMGFPVRDKSTDSPPLILANRTLQAAGEGSLSEQQKPPVEGIIHWTFGVLICVTYGALAEKYPQATVGYGLLFGVALYSITHATVLPALDTEPWFFDNKPAFALSEFTGHLAFGVTAETTRRFISKKLA